jgi:hypothetical protein
MIDTAVSFEDRSGATVFFEHVNFQPRASKAQNFYFLQNGPYCFVPSTGKNREPGVRVTPPPPKKKKKS